MSKQKKLIPKLRFPEFSNKLGWAEKKLGEVLIEGKLGGNYENIEAEEGIPIIKMGNIGRGHITLGKIQYLPENAPYNSDDILKEGDLLLNTRNTLDLVGKVAIWRNELTFALYNSNLLRMKFDENCIASNVFMNYVFNSNDTVRKLKSVATGTTSVAAIYTKDLINLRIEFPSKEEQQKIASCLSSLDEVITAHSQKFELLKEHKKGLMQNLFPQEGENVPRYRFKEFEKDGEWDEKILGNVCNMQAGRFISASEIESMLINDSYPCYGGNGLRGFTKNYTHEGNYSLIGRQGALCGNVNLVKGKFYATEHAVVVTPQKGIDTIWLFYILDLLNLNQYATGQAQPGLSVNNLIQVKLNVPANINEQRKIASCLSALDELITAQANKIEQLKLHKKGLMQGLFPQLKD